MLNWVPGSFLNVINLANSIIGVSILAMPYCFQKCGILLSVLLIVISGILVRIACFLLLKCAIMARRRNFENLAFHALGSTGKLAVEIGIIGFLIGVCIAFFVVIGDLGPPLASEYMMIENTSNLRAEVLVFLGLFVALPLGLLKNVNSLTSLSAFSIAFYGWLVLKIFSEATTKLLLNEWWHQVNWWQVDGLLPCLPIFSMALSCQTQLFEFFDTLSEPSVKRMMSVVNGAVYLCSSVYILVGLFGYIACHDKIITGNILVSLTPSIITECIKLMFVVTVVISFPLCLFPCRTSLHSLLFKQGLGHHEITTNFIPDHRFRFLTISLVIVTISVAIMIPNIEFALGIIGSTIGTMICLIFPAIVFIHDTNKNTFEKRMAQLVMFVGLFILFACTYSTLREGIESKPAPIIKTPDTLQHALIDAGLAMQSSPVPLLLKLQDDASPIDNSKVRNVIDQVKDTKDVIKIVASEKRQEPPVPREPEAKPEKIVTFMPVKVDQKVDLDPQALQKEDKELQKETAHQSSMSSSNLEAQLKDKQEQILRRLEEQQNQQKIIIEQQQKVLKELIMHKESHVGMNSEIKPKEPELPKKDNVVKLEQPVSPQSKLIQDGSKVDIKQDMIDSNNQSVRLSDKNEKLDVVKKPNNVDIPNVKRPAVVTDSLNRNLPGEKRDILVAKNYPDGREDYVPEVAIRNLTLEKKVSTVHRATVPKATVSSPKENIPIVNKAEPKPMKPKDDLSVKNHQDNLQINIELKIKQDNSIPNVIGTNISNAQVLDNNASSKPEAEDKNEMR